MLLGRFLPADRILSLDALLKGHATQLTLSFSPNSSQAG